MVKVLALNGTDAKLLQPTTHYIGILVGKTRAVQAAIFGAPAVLSTVQPVQHSLGTDSGSDSDERPQVVELEQQPAHLPAETNADVRCTPSANFGIVCCLGRLH